MILEPIMMNAGIILPEDGYLAGLKELLHAHGALLAFDEVKTGLTAGPSGAVGVTGVTPDIICLAKAIGGGISVAAIGGTHEVMKHVANGDYEQVGTFNGNPLAMAATRAMLHEVVTPEAYSESRPCAALAVDGVSEAIARYGLDGQRRLGRRQGLHRLQPGAGPRLPRLPGHQRLATATRTGCSSTTAASSCRRGASPSSG